MLRQTTAMASFVHSTTNPTIVEVGVEFFLPSDCTSWIPNGFDMVQFCVDSVELEDDRDATLEDAAEQFCKSIGVVFTRVIESDLW
jgi:hypothetical protein